MHAGLPRVREGRGVTCETSTPSRSAPHPAPLVRTRQSTPQDPAGAPRRARRSWASASSRWCGAAGRRTASLADLKEARDQAQILEASLSRGDIDGAERANRRFQDLTESAAGRTDGWVWGVFEAVPVFGDDAEGLATVSDGAVRPGVVRHPAGPRVGGAAQRRVVRPDGPPVPARPDRGPRGAGRGEQCRVRRRRRPARPDRLRRVRGPAAQRAGRCSRTRSS